jgi:hypothetical protein
LGEAYPGIEVKLRAYGNNVEKLFYVKPGADPEQIKIRVEGIIPPNPPLAKGGAEGSIAKGGVVEIWSEGGLRINESGELEVETEVGRMRFTKPLPIKKSTGRGKR